MYEKCYLFTLNENLRLESIRDLLREDYSFVPNTLKEYGDDIEYKNINVWGTPGETITLNERTKYFIAEGSMEVLIDSALYKDGTLKPKEYRVNRMNVSVIFLEINVATDIYVTYALMEGAGYQVQAIKTHLLGSKVELMSREFRKKWKISRENIYLNFAEDFFLWILLKKEKKEIYFDNIRITDINHIDDINEMHNREHKTSGDNILSDLLSSVALTLEPKLLSLGILVETVLGKFDFVLNTDSSIILKEESSFLIIDNENVPIDEDNKKIVYLYIYGYILPNFVDEFNQKRAELTEFQEEKTKFLYTQGKKAFLRLANSLGYVDKAFNHEDVEKIEIKIEEKREMVLK